MRIIILCAMLVMTAQFAVASGYIDTPDQCLVVAQIKEDGIYLAPAAECLGKAGRASVELSPGTVRQVFVDNDPIGEQTVKTLEIADVVALKDRAAALAEKMKIPENPHRQAMEAEAQKTKDVYDSAEFQGKLRKETKRIAEKELGEQFAAYYQDSAATADAVMGKLGEGERVYIFISESMPVSVIRTYVGAVASLKDKQFTLVLRGFIGGMGKMGPTTAFVTNVLKKNTACELSADTPCSMWKVKVVVDPLLFRRYEIDQVPAIVYARGVKINNPDTSEGMPSHADVAGFYSIFGDVSLKYALNKFDEAAGEDRFKAITSALR